MVPTLSQLVGQSIRPVKQNTSLPYLTSVLSLVAAPNGSACSPSSSSAPACTSSAVATPAMLNTVSSTTSAVSAVSTSSSAVAAAVAAAAAAHSHLNGLPMTVQSSNQSSAMASSLRGPGGPGGLVAAHHLPHFAAGFPWAARGKPRRGMMRRAVFSDAQRQGLEKRFQIQKYISKPDRKKLAEKLGLKDSQVSQYPRTVDDDDAARHEQPFNENRLSFYLSISAVLIKANDHCRGLGTFALPALAVALLVAVKSK